MVTLALWTVLAAAASAVRGAVTVYGQIPMGHLTTSIAADAAPLPTLAAYDGLVLNPPAPPDTPVTEEYFQVPRDAAQLPGLSIPHSTASAFFGFSVEMSVITQTSEFPLPCLLGAE